MDPAGIRGVSRKFKRKHSDDIHASLSLGSFLSRLNVGRSLHGGQVFPSVPLLKGFLYLHMGEGGLQRKCKSPQLANKPLGPLLEAHPGSSQRLTYFRTMQRP